ncbi:hypothetical protein M758_1G216300 [Ceratodon purpureus]|nr:hypothetical protein M758_1G216300 [Ceratodon purpureus]
MCRTLTLQGSGGVGIHTWMMLVLLLVPCSVRSACAAARSLLLLLSGLAAVARWRVNGWYVIRCTRAGRALNLDVVWGFRLDWWVGVGGVMRFGLRDGWRLVRWLGCGDGGGDGDGSVRVRDGFGVGSACWGWGFLILGSRLFVFGVGRLRGREEMYLGGGGDVG